MITHGKPAKLFRDAIVWGLEAGHRVLDIGTPRRFHKELAPLESLFDPSQYHAAGYLPERTGSPYDADSHQDIEALTFDDASFDFIICLEVLEHVRNPRQAVAEIHRVLRPGGRVVVTTPFLYGYHGKGSTSHSHAAYPDFWRFTHEGLAVLFSTFSSTDTIPLHGPLETKLLSLRLFRLINLPGVRRILDYVDKPECRRATSRFLTKIQG